MTESRSVDGLLKKVNDWIKYIFLFHGPRKEKLLCRKRASPRGVFTLLKGAQRGHYVNVIRWAPFEVIGGIVGKVTMDIDPKPSLIRPIASHGPGAAAHA